MNDEEELPKVKPNQWLVNGNVRLASGKTISKMESGKYRIEETREGIIFIQDETMTDELLVAEDSLEKKISLEIEEFWKKKDVFAQLGFLHRRGIILYGPPGTGKTSLINLIVANHTANNGITFYCKDGLRAFMDGLKTFREVEPERPMLCLFEDIEEIIRYNGARQLLGLLDGENNINHCINIATTNFINQLDSRIVGRPKRFDCIYKIGYPTANMRRVYFTKKLKNIGVTDEVIETYVGASEGLSFAALADVVISTKCFNEPLGKVIKKLKTYQKATNAKAKEGDVLEFDD
jgi:SpoVK/Ycf46/Vps4 family AAA+-type ATPase